MAVLKKKSTSNSANIKPMFSAKDICKMGEEYAELSAQIKVLDERKKELAEKIKNGAEQFGVKDDKGSYYLESDSYIMGKIAKKSVKIDQEKAVEILESMGLGDVVDEVVVRTVNEKKLEKALADKRITVKVMEQFTNVSTSYSVSVKEKEEAPEVEVSTLKVAKKK